MRTIHVNSRWGRIFVRDSEGKGLPVLLLHGNSLSSETFLYQLEGEPGSRFRLIAFDRLGHGESERAMDAEQAYRLFGLVDQIKEVLSAIQIKRPVLVGHSLGGHVSLQALAHGVSCSGIFIVNTPPLSSPSSIGEAFLPHPSLPYFFKEHLSEEEVALCVQALIRSNEGSNDERLELIRKLLLASDPRVRSVLAGSLEQELCNEVEAFRRATIPKAVGIGEKDALVNRSYLEKVLPPDLWQGDLILFPHTSHTPQMENPEIFNQVLLDFLTAIKEKTVDDGS